MFSVRARREVGGGGEGGGRAGGGAWGGTRGGGARREVGEMQEVGARRAVGARREVGARQKGRAKIGKIHFASPLQAPYDPRQQEDQAGEEPGTSQASQNCGKPASLQPGDGITRQELKRSS